VLAVERRQHDQSRAAVKLAVDRQQPVAHQADQVTEVSFAPVEVGGVGDGDVVVGGWPEHEYDVAVEYPHREDRPEALVGVEQHWQRFLGESSRALQRGAGLAGGEGDARGALFAQVADEDPERARAEQRRGADQCHSARLAKAGQVASLRGRGAAGRGLPY